MERRVPFVDLQAMMRAHGPDLEQALVEVLRSGRFVNGPKVKELEKRLASRAGVQHAVACGSGTAAQQLLLMAMGIGPGDEVLVPDFTFVATAEAVIMAGAVPICVDVDPVTFNMDVDAARDALGPRVKAIVGVSLFGNLAGIDRLEELADEVGIPFIEDACQSFGASLGERVSGSFGQAGFTSFYPSKPLGGLGDGGMVFTDDPELAESVARLAQHGQIGPHLHQHVGMNSRLDELQAAALLVKKNWFRNDVEQRRERAARYDEALEGYVQTPSVPDGCYSSYAQYTIRVVDEASRDDLVAYLDAQGIPTAIHYPRPLHLQPSLQRLARRQPPAPIAEHLCQTVLSLPLSAYLSQEDQDRVIAGVLDWVEVADAAAAGT